ncbi:HAMP domain-containing sensor histidine kinase [Sporosarcina saromensis]|uniref:histidine kinase n=1 Tax=Sporosarcina saromensis TaxID=359365 RepID=A0ABU4GA08_9BACL|nr:HAMP domain-containing sensor histidine kinase [Sporosarcina saromensis]MDW0112417.1 HAMP domain-containing sensor histidine kinase [Sporosarcina saromensis]
MLKRISTKLAAYFILSFLLLESILMIYLHQTIIHARIEEEFERVMANGSNHREVLEDYYSEETMNHIVLMEYGKESEVVITGENDEVIQSSAENLLALNKYLKLLDGSRREDDQLLLDDWKNSEYIVSVHPYQIADWSGHVVMFQKTEPIQRLVDRVNLHFGLAGGVSIIILFVIYLVLSKFLTRPLVHMKEATEKLREGDFRVSLPNAGKDELGELSMAIMELATDLETMKTERNEFLASISHELSTPLTYMIGYLKVAMRNELTDEERMEYLKIIAEESNRMKELVKDLMELAKMDELSFTVEKTYFSAQRFAKELYRLVQPSFELKNINLTILCEKDFQLFADPLRLEQILLNLLDNALKYSEANTDVTMTVYEEGANAVLQVSDEGIGIPHDEIDRIFDKLYRVEKSRSRTSGGSGLGLAIVKELVEAHDGVIYVESRVGTGSTFIVKL